MSFDAYTTSGQGQNKFQPLPILSPRNPVNGVDLNDPVGGPYQIGRYWFNQSNDEYWYYQGEGIWILAAGSMGPLLMFNVPQGVSPVNPTSAGAITFESSDGSVVITGSPNTINFQASSGTVSLNSLMVDASTAPGMNPVMPSMGIITITGGQVASNAVGADVIKTNSLAANTFTIQVQQAGSAASQTTSLNGVSHYNSSQFTVANGFVSITGGIPSATTFTVDANTAPGTNPVTTNSGNVTIEGGATFATGTRAKPIRTNSLAANTIDLEIQLAGSNAGSSSANNFGVAQFDSNSFTVTNGFVQLSSAPFTWHDVTAGTQAIAVNNGYVADNATTVAFSLPATATFGQLFAIVGKLGSWSISQGVGQQILLGNSSSTAGVGGSIASTNAGDSAEFLCITGGTSSVWRIRNAIGNLSLT